MVISTNSFVNETGNAPSGVDSLWKIATHYGLDESWAYDNTVTEFPKLPKGLVWVWLNGLDTPHWSVRGTGALV